MTSNAVQPARQRMSNALIFAAAITLASLTSAPQAQASSQGQMQFAAQTIAQPNLTVAQAQVRRFHPLRTYGNLSPQMRAILNLGLFGSLGLLASLRPFDSRIKQVKRDSQS